MFTLGYANILNDVYYSVTGEGQESVKKMIFGIATRIDLLRFITSSEQQPTSSLKSSASTSSLKNSASSSSLKNGASANGNGH